MRKLLIICGIVLTGCSSVPTGYSPQPISTVQTDCRFASRMSADLETVIQNPHRDYPEWHRAFSALSGFGTAQQRTASAKTVLWSIRTNCRGF